MTNKQQHPNAEILRAIADGKAILNMHGERLTAQRALMLLAKKLGECLTIAPETIVVNGHTVPAPYRGEMEIGQKYWVASPTDKDYASSRTWCDDDLDHSLMARGLVRLSESAAKAHGWAMALASMERVAV